MYTIIAYKPESTERIRGCDMEYYSSELITATAEDKEQLAKEVTHIFSRNATLRSQEARFGIQIYHYGKLVWDQIENYGYVEQHNGKTEFGVAADLLEERGFDPEVINLLRAFSVEDNSPVIKAVLKGLAHA